MGSRSSARSCYKKTVTLQDWWLIKPETDDDIKVLGVAGITYNSQQYRTAPARCFTSAPMSKVFDIFELETVDDVSIILQGFINKDRTLQNGFSPEVFKHFVFGFPVYWEEFSATCPKRATSVHEDGKDEEHDVFHDCDDYFVDPEIKDCQHKSDKTNTVGMESSPEHIVNTRDEVLCEKTPVMLEVEDDPRLVMNPMSVDVDDIKHNVLKKNPDLSKKSLVGSSSRMTRSMRKMDIFSLDKVTLVDPVKDKNDDLSNNKAVDSDVMSESMKNIIKVSGGYGKDEDKVRSKRKPNDQNVDVTEDVIRKESTSQVGQKKNKEDLQTDKGRGGDFNFASGVPDVNDDYPKATMKACQNKKNKKAHRPESKKAITTRSRSKSKVTPQREMPKRKPLVTTPSRAIKGVKDLYGSPNIVSPEDFSGKKSRSGRVLLPSLEFWRNQKVVYDKDHQVYGIQEPL